MHNPRLLELRVLPLAAEKLPAVFCLGEVEAPKAPGETPCFEQTGQEGALGQRVERVLDPDPLRPVCTSPLHPCRVRRIFFFSSNVNLA